MHCLDPLVAFRQGESLAEIEGILHLTGRVVLRLEQGVEVPVGLLDDAAVEFGKSHVEQDLPHLGDDPLVGVDLTGICFSREFGDIIFAEVEVLPLARYDLFAGEGAGLLPEVESFIS